MATADVPGSAEAALEAFAEEPFVFALKPVVKQVLQSIASSKSSQAQVIPTYFLNQAYCTTQQRCPAIMLPSHCLAGKYHTGLRLSEHNQGVRIGKEA